MGALERRQERTASRAQTRLSGDCSPEAGTARLNATRALRRRKRYASEGQRGGCGSAKGASGSRGALGAQRGPGTHDSSRCPPRAPPSRPGRRASVLPHTQRARKQARKKGQNGPPPGCARGTEAPTAERVDGCLCTAHMFDFALRTFGKVKLRGVALEFHGPTFIAKHPDAARARPGQQLLCYAWSGMPPAPRP